LDESLWERDGFEPRLAWFDPDAQTLWPVDGQSLDGRVLTATVDHFSIYVVLDAAAFDKVEHPVIIPPSTGAQALDVVFVNDVSGSMTTSDRTGRRALAIRTLMEGLIKGDRAGLVSFDTTARVREPLTSDWMGLLKTLDALADDGSSTCGTCGLAAGLGLFGDRPVTQARRVVVFLTDGQDNASSGYTYDQLIAQAVADDIVVHTIGLGPGVDSAVLKRIALETGGAHQAGGAGDLVTYYTDIREASDPTDSNNDGISDYYTRLMTDRGLYAGTGARVFGTATYEQVQGRQVDFDRDGTVSALEALTAKTDFDGDGIKNGDEIEFSTVVQRDIGGFELVPRVYVRLKSSPISTDSDGDGYGDLTENTWPTAKGGPHDPMISDVDRLSLSNPDYVPIGPLYAQPGGEPINSRYLGDPVAYGGNQSWFYEKGSSDLDGNWAQNLGERGCGVIAWTDLALYLGSSNPDFGALAQPIRDLAGYTGFSPLAYQVYAQVVYEAIPSAMQTPSDWLGIVVANPIFGSQASGRALLDGLDGELPSTGVPPGRFDNHATDFMRSLAPATTAHVDGPLRGSTSYFEETIRRNIKANLPVPIMTWLASDDLPYYDESGVHALGSDLRVDRNQDGYVRGDDYDGFPTSYKSGDDHFDFTLTSNPPLARFHDHYVTVTEYIEDRFDGKTKLVVVSWGEKMIIEPDSLTSAALGRFGGLYRVVS
jgi:hypothetical protein